MEIVNIHEAKTRLSRLLEQVSRGKPFIIAKVVAVDAPEQGQGQRLDGLGD